jgi:hypothetical protein
MPGQGWPAFPDRSYGGITGTKFALGGATTMNEFYKQDQRYRDRMVRAKRVAEAKLKGAHTKLEWLALLHMIGDCCARCGSKERVAKDHIVPISSGGCDCIANIQPLCGRCNSAKGTDVTDYRPGYWTICLEDVLATVPAWVKL